MYYNSLSILLLKGIWTVSHLWQNIFSTWLYQCMLLPGMFENFSYFSALSTPNIFSLFILAILGGLWYGIVIWIWTGEIDHLFICLSAIWITSFVKDLPMSLLMFKIWIVSPPWICSSFYVLGKSPFSNKCIENFFYQSVACLLFLSKYIPTYQFSLYG